MLRLLKNRIFSSATSDIIKNVRTIFETLDTGLLLDVLCHVNSERKNDVRQNSQKYSKLLWRKIAFDPKHRD